jgi:hypothetical protein
VASGWSVRWVSQLLPVLLLTTLGGCSGEQPTSTPPTVTTAPVHVQPPSAELSRALTRHIAEYESLYYTYRPVDRRTGDWSRLDRELEPWLLQRPTFATYYRWARAQHRRDSAPEVARSPAMLRGDLARYLEYVAAHDAEQVASVGETVRTIDWELTVLRYESFGREALVWSASGESLRSRQGWVVILVQMQNIAQHPARVNPYAFLVRDDLGETYQFPAVTGATAYSRYSDSNTSALEDEVPAGHTVFYRLPFDVGPGFWSLRLIFVDGMRSEIEIGTEPQQ